MGKGEIARYEQFVLFPQCFQKACFPGASKGAIVWEWVKYEAVYRILCLMKQDSNKTDEDKLLFSLTPFSVIFTAADVPVHAFLKFLFPIIRII